MTLIADIFLIAGALGAAFYCMVLSRRLRRFADLENGVGGAVAVLSVQVDDMTRSIKQAERAAADSAARLNELTARSEGAARRLELMIAAMHDLPADPAEPPATVAERPVEPASAEDEPMVRKRPQTIFSSRRAFSEKAA